MNTSRYSLMLLILSLSQLLSINLFARENFPADTLTAAVRPQPFVRIAMDVSSVARSLVEPEVRQLEFALDTEIRHNWFANLEGGWMNVASQTEGYHYISNGFFMRAGADYNLLGRPTPAQNDLVTFGLRYGYSFQQHEAPFYLIRNPYWGEYENMLSPEQFHAHWLEFAGGVKTEVFRNLFIGWSLRARVKLYTSRSTDLQPYYLPGYGQGNRRAPVMIHYSILYRFNL